MARKHSKDHGGTIEALTAAARTIHEYEHDPPPGVR